MKYPSIKRQPRTSPTKHWRTLALIGVCLLLPTGCAFRSNQVNTVSRVASALSTDQSMQAQAMNYAYEVSFAGMSVILYPVSQQGQRTVFSNAEKVTLTWDGESVITLENWPGAFGRYEQGIEPGSQSSTGFERWYAQAGTPIMRLACTPRRQWRLSPTRSGWRDTCTGDYQGERVTASHSVEWDAQGQLREIRAPLSSTVQLRLKKLR
jgi:YD repeat-containing protein